MSSSFLSVCIFLFLLYSVFRFFCFIVLHGAQVNKFISEHSRFVRNYFLLSGVFLCFAFMLLTRLQ